MVIVIIYLEEMYICESKHSDFPLSVWYSQSSSMVNVFGASIGEKGLGNIQVLRKVIAILESTLIMSMRFKLLTN